MYIVSAFIVINIKYITRQTNDNPKPNKVIKNIIFDPLINLIAIKEIIDTTNTRSILFINKFSPFIITPPFNLNTIKYMLKFSNAIITIIAYISTICILLKYIDFV